MMRTPHAWKKLLHLALEARAAGEAEAQAAAGDGQELLAGAPSGVGSCIAWVASFSQCEGTLMNTCGRTSGRRVEHARADRAR